MVPIADADPRDGALGVHGLEDLIVEILLVRVRESVHTGKLSNSQGDSENLSPLSSFGLQDVRGHISANGHNHASLMQRAAMNVTSSPRRRSPSAIALTMSYGPPIAKLMLRERDLLNASNSRLLLFQDLQKGVGVSSPLHVDCPEIKRPRMRVDALLSQVTNPALPAPSFPVSSHTIRGSMQRNRLLMTELPSLKEFAFHVRFGSGPPFSLHAQRKDTQRTPTWCFASSLNGAAPNVPLRKTSGTRVNDLPISDANRLKTMTSSLTQLLDTFWCRSCLSHLLLFSFGKLPSGTQVCLHLDRGEIPSRCPSVKIPTPPSWLAFGSLMVLILAMGPVSPSAAASSASVAGLRRPTCSDLPSHPEVVRRRFSEPLKLTCDSKHRIDDSGVRNFLQRKLRSAQLLNHSDSVEEQVHKGDLQAVRLHDCEGCQHRGERGADVCPKSHGKHLVHREHADTAEWRQCGGGHRAGLDDKGDAKANKDGDVVVHVCGTHDHLLRAAHNQGVQELHKAEQEEGDDDQREDQAHDPPGNVPHSREGTPVKDGAALDGLCVEFVSLQVAGVRATAVIQEREVGAAL